MGNKQIGTMKTFEFLNKHELENHLVDQIITDLTDDIKTLGRAKMLVSGGSTPVDLFKKLSKNSIDWDKVDIGLVDERFVPTNSEHSNERLVKENLLVNEAENAPFTGMIYFSNDVFKNLEKVEEEYLKFSKNVTVTILGMGTDGHTASLFPGDQPSEEDLKNQSNNVVLNTQSPSDPKRRVSCSKQTILNSKNLYLMLVGEDKMSVFNQAHILKLPISHFFENLNTYYASKK